MKTMLFVGATLMIGASIYGFLDYRQTHNNKEFKEMYVEKKAEAPFIVVAGKEKKAEPGKITAVTEKPAVSRKRVTVKKESINPIKPIAEEDKMVVEKKNLNEGPAVTKEPAKESSAIKTVKKKKVRKEFFSRGRMPEEEIEMEPVIKENKKTQSKEL
jgi:hypothetical protein